MLETKQAARFPWPCVEVRWD